MALSRRQRHKSPLSLQPLCPSYLHLKGTHRSYHPPPTCTTATKPTSHPHHHLHSLVAAPTPCPPYPPHSSPPPRGRPRPLDTPTARPPWPRRTVAGKGGAARRLLSPWRGARRCGGHEPCLAFLHLPAEQRATHPTRDASSRRWLPLRLRHADGGRFGHQGNLTFWLPASPRTWAQTHWQYRRRARRRAGEPASAWKPGGSVAVEPAAGGLLGGVGVESRAWRLAAECARRPGRGSGGCRAR